MTAFVCLYKTGYQVVMYLQKKNNIERSPPLVSPICNYQKILAITLIQTTLGLALSAFDANLAFHSQLVASIPLGHDNGRRLRPNFAEAALKITNIQPQSRQSSGAGKHRRTGDLILFKNQNKLLKIIFRDDDKHSVLG